MVAASKRRVFGSRAVVPAGSAEQRIRGWRPQGFDIVLAIVLAVGLAVAFRTIW